jgi:hypothetical protein
MLVGEVKWIAIGGFFIFKNFLEVISGIKAELEGNGYLTQADEGCDEKHGYPFLQ